MGLLVVPLNAAAATPTTGTAVRVYSDAGTSESTFTNDDFGAEPLALAAAPSRPSKGEISALQVIFVAADTDITYGGHDVGPLSESVANTFRSGSYTERTRQSDTTLHRVYGGKAGPVGSYWSTTAPSGPLQAQLDGAINPAWWNTIERVATTRVRAGTAICEGAAGPQGLAGGGSLYGGGSQVHIPSVNPSWVTP